MFNKEEINKIYKWQIEKGYNNYLDYTLFNLTHDFTLSDWKKIRNNNGYWETLDSLTLIKKKEFTLKMVKNYLKKY